MVTDMVYSGYGANQPRNPASITVQAIAPVHKEQYFYQLQCQGWQQLGGPMEYQLPAPPEQLRAWAQEYAAQNGGDLVIEVEEPGFSNNPHNNMVFYVFQHAATAQQAAAAGAGAGAPADPYGFQQQAGPEPRAYTCTNCGRPFAAHPQPQPSYVNCPNCGGPVLISLETGTVIPKDPAGGGGGGGGGGGTGTGGACSDRYTVSSSKKLVLMSSYASNDQALDDCLEKLAMLLAKDDCPLKFSDTGLFLHPSLTIGLQVYLHMGSRTMDLVLVHDGVHDYTLMGNESHTSGGNISPMRDNLVTIKTLGATTYMPLSGLKELDPTQKDKITRIMFQWLSQYITVI